MTPLTAKVYVEEADGTFQLFAAFENEDAATLFVKHTVAISLGEIYEPEKWKIVNEA